MGTVGLCEPQTQRSVRLRLPQVLVVEAGAGEDHDVDPRWATLGRGGVTNRIANMRSEEDAHSGPPGMRQKELRPSPPKGQVEGSNPFEGTTSHLVGRQHTHRQSGHQLPARPHPGRRACQHVLSVPLGMMKHP